MHQDFDPRDLEPVAPPPQQSGAKRWVPLAIALAAVGGFGGIVWYAYSRGGSQVAENPALAPLIQADAGAYKRRPDDPGGAIVPNQDKLLLNQGMANADGRVERILPPPEAPLPKPVAPPPQLAQAAVPPAPQVAAAPPAPPPPISAPRASVQTTPMAGQTVPVRQTQPAPAPTPLAPAQANANQTAQQPAQAPVVIGAPPKPLTPPSTAPAGQPQQLAMATPPKPAPATAAQPAAAAPPKPAAGGSYRIQLASVKTAEQAEKEWQRIKGGNPEVAGLQMTPTKVDLGEKGIFYRIQAGPVGDAATADRLCSGLKSKGQGCMVVKP